MKILLALVTIMVILLPANNLYGRDEFLPNWETDEEKEGRIAKAASSAPEDIDRIESGDYPEVGVRTVAEFESSQGFLISWSTYDWYTTSIFIELLQKYSAENYAYIIVMNENEKDDITRRIIENDISLTNIRFIEIETNSCWIRDYAPIFVYDYRDSLAAVDMLYYPGRDEDDHFPESFCVEYSIPRYDMELYIEGGNFMTDGQGLILTTEAIYGANIALSRDEVDSTLMRYFGADRIIALQPLEFDGTAHVDMFAKFIDSETILVNMPLDTSSGDFSRMQYNVSVLETLTLSSGYGSFEVKELPLIIEERSWPPGWNYHTYTNSLIIDSEVFVPVYNNEIDDSVLMLYQSLMPDHEIESIDCSAIINSGGAVHCLAMQIPEARKLQVESSFAVSKPEIIGKVYPNPFNSSVSIEIAQNSQFTGPFEIEIFDLIGMRVKAFHSIEEGQTIKWNAKGENGREVASGVYLIEVSNGKGDSEYHKLIYSK